MISSLDNDTEWVGSGFGLRGCAGRRQDGVRRGNGGLGTTHRRHVWAGAKTP